MAGKRREGGRELTVEQQLESIGQYLRSPLTDWDAFYLRLRSSRLGEDFPRDRFVRTPINLLKKALDFVVDQGKQEANRDSVTQSVMTDLMLKIAHGFSGSKKRPPKTRPMDFLPYPNYKPPGADSDEADEPTKFVLAELVKQRRLPIYVFKAMMGRAQDQP